jgi:hypothetical protein
MLRLENRKPQQTSVREAQAGWIQVRGVQVDLDRRLLLQEEAPALPPARLLLEPEGEAGRWWSETHGLAARVREGGAAADEARGQLVRRFARLQGSPADHLPAPGRAIVMVGQDLAYLSAGPQDGANGGDLADFHAQTEEQIDLVLRRVQPDVGVQGILDETPPVLVRRLGEELPLAVPERLLAVDRRPRELESVVFGVSAILLLFLIAGLLGARGAHGDAGDV